ncbi:tripartite tricarboxylate transporter substrate-binding protein [Methylocella sp. CPCC 101449]|jgi:tripartite-type tricarboxylate transporter receptor subunit TctC|uniref:Bug family tripartite tricarboxylate transporter substrate binding protein n=1 Tax=Methylocella sp. CPCC 101449 TaxID=2987531 RepID=UPI00288DFBCF|nr:tripartite tricarboxylate transporter substrate-binding protein [Methylocella sp. CPCC 101449]MDT2024037.1 tripartite tricarboxylate transporter substrate-binding protein [Methylocella sp. CPCC 101449]HEV2570640.1 tripartite tricarboxylate transporter substrate-binding protein [Beijerinckiaceae bacterium]
MKSLGLGGILLAGLVGVSPAMAQSPEQFFAGKTITVTIGFSPGGTYDLFGRMLSRYLGKYVPGKPTVIASNMPGAGSLTAANWLYRVAPKDGTAMAIVAQTIAQEEALKNKAVQYKTAEFNWIGRATSNIEVQVVSTRTKGTTMQGMKEVEVPTASTGPGSPSESYPKLLNALAGTKFKIIRGYPGSTDGLLAMERGETDSALTSWNTMKTTRMDWLTGKKAAVSIQYVLERSKDLKDVPAVTEFASNDADRALLAFAASSADIGRAFMAPPGVPADRIKALREAFMAAMKDPDLLAEVEKAKLDFDPASGEVVQKIVADVIGVSPDIVARMEKILAAE